MSNPSNHKLSAHDLIHLSDEGLDEYLQHFGANPTISVQDPENLPTSDDFRRDFGKRLIDSSRRNEERRQASHQAPPDQLFAKLAQLQEIRATTPSDTVEEPQSLPQVSRSSDPAHDNDSGQYKVILEEEEAYKAYVGDGGRPIYQVASFPRESRGSGPISAIEGIWQTDDPDDFTFNSQWFRWQDFRRFQKFMRIQDEQDSTELAIPSLLPTPSEAVVPWSMLTRDFNAAPESTRFSVYLQVARSRLIKYAMDPHLKLDLEIDPSRQNPLVTWKEYLIFECWTLWFFDRSHKSKGIVRRGLERLREDGLIEANDTRETLYDRHRREADRQQVLASERVMHVAQSKLSSARAALSKISSSSPGGVQVLREQVNGALAKFEEAQKIHTELKTRNKRIIEFLMDTSWAHRMLDQVERHRVLIKWVEEQIPMIEQEMRLGDAQRQMADTNDVGPSPTAIGKKRASQDSAHEERPRKRSKTQRPGALIPTCGATEFEQDREGYFSQDPSVQKTRRARKSPTTQRPVASEQAREDYFSQGSDSFTTSQKRLRNEQPAEDNPSKKKRQKTTAGDAAGTTNDSTMRRRSSRIPLKETMRVEKRIALGSLESDQVRTPRRPREQPVPEIHKSTKRGPGRPRKQPVPEIHKSTKRGPGRPRKQPVPEIHKSTKRGPGRPRKHPTPKEDKPSKQAHKKSTKQPVPQVDEAHKRPPGRPKKIQTSQPKVTLTDQAQVTKDQPSLNKRPLGRPRKNPTVAALDASDAGATLSAKRSPITGKRPPGRPRKNLQVVTNHDDAQRMADFPTASSRPQGRPERHHGVASSSLDAGPTRTKRSPPTSHKRPPGRPRKQPAIALSNAEAESAPSATRTMKKASAPASRGNARNRAE